MDKIELNEFIKNKEERQQQLEKLNADVQTLHTHLWSSKVSRFFNSSALFLKSALTAILAILLISGSAVLLISPGMLISNPEIENQIVELYIQDYMDKIDGATKTAFAKAIQNGNTAGIEEGLQLFMKGMNQEILKEVKSNLRLLGALLLSLGLILLYIASMINAQRARNSKISDAQSISQNITEEIEKLVNLNKEELQALKSTIPS